MKLYIIRHGETFWNKEGRIQGASDIELNENGLEQAYKTKEKLDDISFDVCLSSPLKRAKKTAEIIVNGKCDVICDDLLMERGYGDYEGKKVNELDIDLFRLWDYKENYNSNNIESLKAVLNRASLFIEQLKENYKNASNILIVSHGGFIKGLYYAINGYDENTDFLNFHLGNCGIYECDNIDNRSKRMNKKELINLIESLELDKEDFWVLSSGALVLRGILEDAGDLDIGVSEKGLLKLKEKFNLKEKGNGWYTVNDKIECVLDKKDVENVEGINVESINRYYKYLLSSSREKDKLRIPLVEKYIGRKTR